MPHLSKTISVFGMLRLRLFFVLVLSLMARVVSAQCPMPTPQPGGTLDTCFPQTGTGFNGSALAFALQPDGKVLVGGNFTSYNGIAVNRICRLNADGSLDASFSAGTGFNNAVNILALQPDGKVLVGGFFTTYNGTAVNRICRLNADGSLDAGFGAGTGFNNTVYTLALQPDGKVLMGGEFTSYNGTAVNRICRLNADGGLDASFSVGTGFNFTVFTLALQPDGKVLVCGNFTSYNGTSRVRICRLNADGSLDAGFGIGTGFNNTVLTLALQPDGKVLVGGIFTTYNGIAVNRICRLNADGGLDAGFSVGTGFNNTVWTLAQQPDGKVLVGGNFTSYNGTGRNFIARLFASSAVPYFTGISPATGGAGTTVTLTGQNLAGITQVRFGTAVATVTSATAAQILVNVPASAVLGAQYVEAIAPVSSINRIAFTVVCPTFAAPTITAAGPTTFCAGGSVQLQGPALSANEAYLWSTGATTQNITVSTAGSYTLQIRSTVAACTSAVSNALVVAVDTLPAQPAITFDGPTAVCTGDQTRLEAPAGFAAYTWSPGGATTRAINAGVGSYTVRVTDGNGCQSVASAAAVVSASGVCVAQWNGDVSQDWSNPANWTPAGVPLAGDSVVIAQGANLPSVAGVTLVARSLQVQPQASLALGAGSTLQLSGNLWAQGAINGAGTVLLQGSVRHKVSGTVAVGTLAINSAQGAVLLTDNTVSVTRSLGVRGAGAFNLQGNRLRLRSSASGQAYLETVAAGSLQNAQNLSVERFVPGPGLNNWAFVGAMVEGQRVDGWASPSNTYLASTFDAGNASNSSLFSYDPFARLPLQNNGYTRSWAAASDPAPVGRGYRVWLKPSFYAAGGKFVQQGSPKLGDHTYTLQYCPSNCAWPQGSADNGWNLVANPYAGPLDWEAASGWQRQNLSPAWWTYNRSIANWATYLPGVGGVNGGSRLIAVGQSFFVKALAASPGLTVRPAAVSAAHALGGQASFLRQGQADQVLRLELSAPGQGSDELLLAFSAQASRSFNPIEDAEKMGGDLALTAVSADGRSLAIGSWPELGPADTVVLKVRGQGTLALRLTEQTAQRQVYLLDRVLNRTTALTRGQTLNLSPESTGSRYALVLAPASVTGLDNLASRRLQAVPNPAAHSFVLEGLATAAEVTLTDATGRQVLQVLVRPGQPIAVGLLPAGMYHWRAGTARGTVVVE